MLTKDDVGKLFTVTGQDAWKMSYFHGGDALPSGGRPDRVVMVRLDADGMIREHPEALKIRQFKRLVVEEK